MGSVAQSPLKNFQTPHPPFSNPFKEQIKKKKERKEKEINVC